MRPVFAMWWLVLACEPTPPGALDDVQFPDGVALETSHEAALEVRLTDALRAREPWVRIELPDGRPLSEGQIAEDVTYTLRLPAGERRVRVTALVGDAVVADAVAVPGEGAAVVLGL